MKNNQKGITLIALVITIIVLIVLAGITISILVGDNGIISNAQKARVDTKTAQERESEALNGKIVINGKEYDSMEDYANGKEGTPVGAEKFSSIYTQDADYIDANGKTARIPKGFAVGTSSGINTIAGGLVITDSVAANGTSNGNEFVWIPVDDINVFVRTGWVIGVDASTEAELDNNLVETEDANYNVMKASVQKWKGFYIARFEAGTTIARGRGFENRTDLTPQSQKLLYPYNYISCADAQTLSENWYTENSNYGVTSTLCYGVQWDTTMRFIKDSKNVSNSTTWGNYFNNEFEYEGKIYRERWGQKAGGRPLFLGAEWIEPEEATKANEASILLQTGACSNNQAKNIYDLAGNVGEWTMEIGVGGCVQRGGYYSGSGDEYPAAERLKDEDTITAGFRPALYITATE